MTWYTMTKPDDSQGQVADETTGKTIAVSYDAKDAQLIAAAPDLLEAAKRALIAIKALPPRNGEDRYEPLMQLSAAIAKAEGR